MTWTASGEPVREVWTDEHGVQHVTRRVEAAVSGTGFGLTSGGESSFGQVARTRTVDAA
ncbi:hypothetical protein [Micromonospora sp. NPDC005806]|uniref:hypothetical protein n=1 Tax=Micromonospora sp. NPDC005806 TaxID=3364234 RepID=UPI00367E4752